MPARLNYAKASPESYQAMMALEKVVRDTGIDPALLDLLRLRVSQINGCAFCIDMHSHEAMQRGEPAYRLFLLDAWRETDAFTPRERAALAWAEALTRLPNHGVSDELYEAMHGAFSEKEIADVTLAIVAINGWNRFGVGFASEPMSVTRAKREAANA